MKRYTLGILFSEDFRQVLLIKKVKPEWQADRYNFPGGKIEPNETSVQCVAREFLEETGLTINLWRLIGQIVGRDYIVDIFTQKHNEKNHGVPGSMTDEIISWHSTDVELITVDLISNLKWLIPFALNTHLQGNADDLSFGTFEYT